MVGGELKLPKQSLAIAVTEEGTVSWRRFGQLINVNEPNDVIVLEIDIKDNPLELNPW